MFICDNLCFNPQSGIETLKNTEKYRLARILHGFFNLCSKVETGFIERENHFDFHKESKLCF